MQINDRVVPSNIIENKRNENDVAKQLPKLVHNYALTLQQHGKQKHAQVKLYRQDRYQWFDDLMRCLHNVCCALFCSEGSWRSQHEAFLQTMLTRKPLDGLLKPTYLNSVLAHVGVVISTDPENLSAKKNERGLAVIRQSVVGHKDADVTTLVMAAKNATDINILTTVAQNTKGMKLSEKNQVYQAIINNPRTDFNAVCKLILSRWDALPPTLVCLLERKEIRSNPQKQKSNLINILMHRESNSTVKVQGLELVDRYMRSNQGVSFTEVYRVLAVSKDAFVLEQLLTSPSFLQQFSNTLKNVSAQDFEQFLQKKSNSEFFALFLKIITHKAMKNESIQKAVLALNLDPKTPLGLSMLKVAVQKAPTSFSLALLKNYFVLPNALIQVIEQQKIRFKPSDSYLVSKLLSYKNTSDDFLGFIAQRLASWKAYAPEKDLSDFDIQRTVPLKRDNFFARCIARHKNASDHTLLEVFKYAIAVMDDSQCEEVVRIILDRNERSSVFRVALASCPKCSRLPNKLKQKIIAPLSASQLKTLVDDPNTSAAMLARVAEHKNCKNSTVLALAKNPKTQKKTLEYLIRNKPKMITRSAMEKMRIRL